MSQLLRRIYEHTEDHLPQHQIGFRSLHSTELQILRLVEFVQEGFQHKDHSGILLLDVAKAFDRVWNDALLLKLQRLHHHLVLGIYVISLSWGIKKTIFVQGAIIALSILTTQITQYPIIKIKGLRPNLIIHQDPSSGPAPRS